MEGRSQTADAVLRDGKAHPAYQAIARTVRAELAVFRGEQRSAARLLDRSLIELRQLAASLESIFKYFGRGVLL